MSDIFLGVPDSSWLDFAYRHNRIPVVGNRAKCALSMDVKEATLGSKEYGFGLTTTVKRKQFTAILTIRENDKIIYEQDFVDTDPPLPSSITVRTINGAPVGYQGYHTAKAANVINQSKNCQIKRINTPYNSLSKRTVPERALTEACYYLLVKRPSLGCKMLRNVIKEFPKSDAAAEASGILNQSRIRTTQVRSTARSDEYENTLPDAEKTWQDIKQLAEGGRYQNAIDKAEIFIKAYPDNIYAGEIREQLLSWKRIVIKPKIEELLTRANNSKSEGDLDKASGYVLTVLSLDPNYSEAKTLHAQLESLKESRRIEAEKEKQFNELKGKAITYEAENNWENAIKTYQEALLVKGGNQEAKERLSICLYNYYIAQAKKEEAEGDLNSAIDLYTQALAQKQSDTIENRLESVKRKLQAETEKKRGKEEASKWLSKAQNAEKDDNFSDAISFYEKAQEYSEVSFTEKINSLKDKIAEKNKITEFGEQLKEARAASNQNPEQALKILERALELYPNNVEALDLKKQITEKNKQDEFSKQTSNIQTTERIPDKAVFPTYDLYQIQTLSGHNGWVTSAAFSPNGDRIVSGSFDLTARIWDAKSGNCLKSLEGHGQLVWAVDFSPDGRRVASGDGWNHTLKIWDAYTGTCIHTIKAHSGDIHGLSFSADGKYVASAGDDSLVKIWDVSTGTCVRTLKGHSNGVFCVAFSPDGKHIASGSWDKKVKIWDSDSGECIRTLTGHESTVERLSYSPDGAKIVSCSMWDNRMIIWDALKGEQLRNIKMYTTGQFYSVAFSPDGCYIVSGNNDGQIQLWDASTGACLRTIKAHKAFPNVIYSVKFSPDGKSILSAGCDKLIKVWALH
jgi:WD40 repeat protein